MHSSYLDVFQYAFTFERVVLTPRTFVTIYIPVALTHYAMAVLVQLPRTSLYRAALLPVLLWLTFRATISLDFSWNDPANDHRNQGFVMGMAACAIRSTVWTFAQRAYVKLPILGPGKAVTDDRHRDTSSAMSKHSISVSSAMWNACDLLVNFRGIGWDGPSKAHLPTPHIQVESRFTFAILSFSRSIVLLLVFCFLSKKIHSFGPDTFGTSKGGTIFDSSLPPAERYMKSSIITSLSGIAVYALVNGMYQLMAACCTIMLQQHPSQWPPLFDSPWLSTSLADFWGRRWHQIFRECFVEAGSKPMGRCFGRVGTIMGAFAVSGVLHDVGSRAMGRGGDALSINGFFLLHGVGVTMEYAWKQVTGRRVGGIVGWLWVFIWFIVSGHFITDVWARRGYIGSLSCQPEPTGLLRCFGI